MVQHQQQQGRRRFTGSQLHTMCTEMAAARSATSSEARCWVLAPASTITRWVSRKSIATEDLIAKLTFCGKVLVLPANFMTSTVATTMPTMLPDLSINGPPLFPGWIGAENCNFVTSSLSPAFAVIFPEVKLPEEGRTPDNGNPYAKTLSPTRAPLRKGWGRTVFATTASAFSRARSFVRSAATTRAATDADPTLFIRIAVQFRTTCALVRIAPSLETNTPVPEVVRSKSFFGGCAGIGGGSVATGGGANIPRLASAICTCSCTSRDAGCVRAVRKSRTARSL